MGLSNVNYFKKEYPLNIILTLLDGFVDEERLELSFGESEEICKLLEESYATITQRESDLIRMRFKDHLSYDKLSETLERSRERVRQIIEKGLRKLRHWTRINKIIKVLLPHAVDVYPWTILKKIDRERLFPVDWKFVPLERLTNDLGTMLMVFMNEAMYSRHNDISIITLSKEQLLEEPDIRARYDYYVKELLEYINEREFAMRAIRNGSLVSFAEDLYDENKKLRSKTKINIDNKTDPFEIKIEDLCLTVRSFNVLCKRGLHTVGDILCYPKEELMGLYGMGEKSYNEICDRIESLGFKIKEDQ